MIRYLTFLLRKLKEIIMGIYWDFLAVPTFLFDFDPESGIAKDGEDKVSAWVSGNITLSQGTGDKQPLWVDSILNGHPIVRFDGGNDYLKGSFTWDQPETLYLVVRTLSFNEGHGLGIFDGYSNATMMLEIWNTYNDLYFMIGVSTIEDTGYSLNTWHIFRAIANGASSSLRRNFVLNTGNLNTTSASGLTVGNAGSNVAPTNIEVARIIGLNFAPTANQDRAIMHLLNTKYKIY